MIHAKLVKWFGIKSPSRIWFDARQSPDLLVVRTPWYSVRGPLEPYEYPELRSAARHVRRLIRRHWYVLFFEPNTPLALSVRAVMSRPPLHVPEKESTYQQMHKLLDARTVEIGLTITDDFLKEMGLVK